MTDLTTDDLKALLRLHNQGIHIQMPLTQVHDIIQELLEYRDLVDSPGGMRQQLKNAQDHAEHWRDIARAQQKELEVFVGTTHHVPRGWYRSLGGVWRRASHLGIWEVTPAARGCLVTMSGNVQVNPADCYSLRRRYPLATMHAIECYLKVNPEGGAS